MIVEFGKEVLEGVRSRANERIEDAVLEEAMSGIRKATYAMKESGVPNETIISMLQKYWDLRLSEATAFVDEVINFIG